MNNKRFSYIAFFDVDETVISVKSMFNFLKHYSQHFSFPVCLVEYFRYKKHLKVIKKMSTQGLSRSEINIQYYRYYQEVSEALLRSLGSDWHGKCLQQNGFYNPQVLSEIAFHKSQNAQIVLVSGSFFACLEPIAKHVQADSILATSLEVVNGKCTGKLLNYPVIGEGKAMVIKTYLDKIGYTDYSKCYAYGDHISDLAMLSMVGNPVVVSKCEQLVSHAQKKSWRIMPL